MTFIIIYISEFILQLYLVDANYTHVLILLQSNWYAHIMQRDKIMFIEEFVVDHPFRGDDNIFLNSIHTSKLAGPKMIKKKKKGRQKT